MEGAGGRRRWFVGGDRTAARIRRRAGDDGRNAQRRHQHDTRRHPATSVSFWDGAATALGFARAPNRSWRLPALKDQRKIPALTISLSHSRARGADDGGRRRRDASYGVARDSHPVSTTAVRGLSWHRSLSGRRARGQRRACEIDLRGARPAPAACAALCVAMDGRRQPTSMVCWCRSDGGEDSAPRRR